MRCVAWVTCLVGVKMTWNTKQRALVSSSVHWPCSCPVRAPTPACDRSLPIPWPSTTPGPGPAWTTDAPWSSVSVSASPCGPAWNCSGSQTPPLPGAVGRDPGLKTHQLSNCSFVYKNVCISWTSDTCRHHVTVWSHSVEILIWKDSNCHCLLVFL